MALTLALALTLATRWTAGQPSSTPARRGTRPRTYAAQGSNPGLTGFEPRTNRSPGYSRFRALPRTAGDNVAGRPAGWRRGACPPQQSNAPVRMLRGLAHVRAAAAAALRGSASYSPLAAAAAARRVKRRASAGGGRAERRGVPGVHVRRLSRVPAVYGTFTSVSLAIIYLTSRSVAGCARTRAASEACAYIYGVRPKVSRRAEEAAHARPSCC